MLSHPIAIESKSWSEQLYNAYSNTDFTKEKVFRLILRDSCVFSHAGFC